MAGFSDHGGIVGPIMTDETRQELRESRAEREREQYWSDRNALPPVSGDAVEIPMAGLMAFYVDLSAIIAEFVNLADTNADVQAAIDTPWDVWDMQDAAAQFEKSWEHRRAEIADALSNYASAVQAVMEKWAGYDESMGKTFQEFLDSTPEGQAKARELEEQAAEGGSFWEGTEQAEIAQRETEKLEQQLAEMSPEELQAFMHDNDIPMENGDVPPHPDDELVFGAPEAPGAPSIEPAPPVEPAPSFESAPPPASGYAAAAPTPSPGIIDSPAPVAPAPVAPVPAEPVAAPPVAPPSFDSAPVPESGQAAAAASASPQILPKDSPLGPLLDSVIGLHDSVGDVIESGQGVVTELEALAAGIDAQADFGSAFLGAEGAIDSVVGSINDIAAQHGLPGISAQHVDDIRNLLGIRL